jgi:two-component system KDP operon response regulator KdpE
VRAGDGTTALTLAAGGDVDVVVLDLGLPDIDGLDVIRALRKVSVVPILVLSARATSGDTVTALDLGADDYVTKPFDVHELLARLRAATRRAQRDATEVIAIGPVLVDLAAKVALRDDEPVHLTPTEWHLLEILLRNPGRLITQARLLTLLRGAPGHTDPSYLRIYVSQLRRKLELEPARPRHLITEPGMGYRFQP